MFIAQGTPPDPESIRTVVILIVILAVLFWKTAIKVLIMGAILLVLVGAFAAVQGLR
jgi:hypothetical protein